MLFPKGRERIFIKGTVFHKALEYMYKGKPLDKIQEEFNQMSDDDKVKIWCMLTGYQAYWMGLDRKNIIPYSIEDKFDVPMYIPGTKEQVSGVRLKGVVDMLAATNDGLYIFEHKTTSADISTGSNYWHNLTMSPQAQMYQTAAEDKGWDVEGVIYNVARTPTIRRKKNESNPSFIKRIVEDMIKTPEKYFRRQLFRFNKQNQEEFERDIYFTWQLMQQVRGWKYAPRYASQCKSGFYMCEYFDLCSGQSSPEDKSRWKRNKYYKLGSGPAPSVSGRIKVPGCGF